MDNEQVVANEATEEAAKQAVEAAPAEQTEQTEQRERREREPREHDAKAQFRNKRRKKVCAFIRLRRNTS